MRKRIKDAAKQYAFMRYEIWGIEDLLTALSKKDTNVEQVGNEVIAHTGQIEIRADRAIKVLENMRKGLKRYQKEVTKWL
jgi:hypothetical protein